MATDDSRTQVEFKIKHGDRALRQLGINLDVQVIDDNLEDSYGMVQSTIASGTTDQEFDFTPITDARFLYIESNQDISIKLNDSLNTAINVTKPSANPRGQVIDPNIKRVGFLLLNTSSVSKVYVSNSSGNEAEVKIFAAAENP